MKTSKISGRSPKPVGTYNMTFTKTQKTYLRQSEMRMKTDFKTTLSHKAHSSAILLTTLHRRLIVYGHQPRVNFQKTSSTLYRSVYINNALPTRKNLLKWGLSSTSDCSSCLQPETLLHVVAGCKTYLDEGRYTWRHDSVLNFLASTLSAIQNSTLYVDLPGFMNPSAVTGDSFRPDLLLTIGKKCLYILELTVGFESNLTVNANRKHQNYNDLIKEQESNFIKVKFVNLSLSTLRVFGRASDSFDNMLRNLQFDSQQSKYIKKKIVTTCIQTSYYIFCKRNKVWDNPKLMSI